MSIAPAGLGRARSHGDPTGEPADTTAWFTVYPRPPWSGDWLPSISAVGRRWRDARGPHGDVLSVWRVRPPVQGLRVGRSPPQWGGSSRNGCGRTDG